MDPNERWKSIAPASDEPGQHRAAPDPKKKRSAIPVACIPCRSGKARCDGIRPRCVRCTHNDLRCQYDVAEGVSRAERMKIIKRDGMATRLEELERIVNALFSGSDNEASNILARLRLGERVGDVANSIQGTVPSDRTSRTSSLGPWESPSSSSKAVGYETIQAQNERRGSKSYRIEFNPSLAPSVEQRPSLPGSSSLSSSAHTSSEKQKQLLKVGQAQEQPFLSIMFNREDCLLPGSDDDNNDKRDGFVGENEANLDPRLLSESSAMEIESPANSPVHLSGLPSPQKHEATRSIHATHLGGRQSIVDAITVHTNLNLNMPFPSSAGSDNFPPGVQVAQINVLSFPTWAMMTVNTRSDPGSLKPAFSNIHQEAMALLESGAAIESIIEIHPNIAALFDEEAFLKSGIISQWAASAVHSLRLSGNSFTDFATMYIFWYLIRWMISPSPETYDAIPKWLRPTPNQLFMPHICVVDFIPWPAFRELVVQLPAMQERMMWLINMMTNIRCDWWHTPDEALSTNEDTGLVDVNPFGKETMRELSNWSVDPSFRGYVSNADSYVRIRTED